MHFGRKFCTLGEIFFHYEEVLVPTIVYKIVDKGEGMNELTMDVDNLHRDCLRRKN